MLEEVLDLVRNNTNSKSRRGKKEDLKERGRHDKIKKQSTTASQQLEIL